MIQHVFPPEMMQQREKQLILALLDCAGVYYDVNFTKNQILGQPIQIVEGVPYPILEQIGKPQNCSFTEIIDYWSAVMPPEEVPAFRAFSDLGSIHARFEAGEELIAHKFWTYDVLGNRMLAEQKVRLYRDCTTGDLLGLVYVSNGGENDNLRKKEAQLSAQYEEAVRRTALLQSASSNLPAGYHRCANEPGLPFLFVSNSFEALTGYTKEQLETELDNLAERLVIPEDLARLSEFNADIANRGSTNIAYRIRRRDGQIRWVQDSSMLVDWFDGPCLQCTINDITDFVHQQEAFARQQAEFDTIAANIPCGYHRCTTDNGFKLEFVSDSFMETVGYDRDELMGMPYFDLVAPEDRELFMSHEPELSGTGRVSLVYRIVRKDGQRRWIKDFTVRVEHEGRSTYQCILADITVFVQEQEEMMRRNLALARKEAMMQTLENSMPSGYHRCKAEPGFPFVVIGQHFEEILGFTAEEIRRDFDNCYRNLIWPEDLHIAQVYDNMRTGQGQGNTYDTSVYRMKHKDGTYRWVTDSTMFVDIGEESYFQGVLADITEYIDSVNEAREQAEASNRAKSAFLFNASHDIRTPMNAIIGFANIIEQNAHDPQRVLDAVSKIKRSGGVLMTLMNDVLELSRIEQGKEEIYLRPLDMVEHVKKLQEMMAEEMAQNGIRFIMENEIVHPLVLADDLKLTRIAMNFLSNAKKFTPVGGTVTFGVVESGFDGKTATYSFFVRDTGIGMSQEFQDHAFEQFERERTSTVSGVSGSGLGLSITKRMAESLGGHCTLSSQLGKGTTACCHVPLQILTDADIQPETLPDTMDFTGKRLLLVEDNEFNREIASYVFTEAGFQVTEAINGVTCLELLNEHAADPFDLVLMDIQMPVMDGYTATQEIRRHPDPAINRVPILAMTANAFEEDRRRCLEAGMNGHISKPLEAETVLLELAKVLKQ